MLHSVQCRHITIGAIHGAASPIEGAPTQEQLATAMGHSTTTARMHYDRCKPQRDAQRAMDGMHAMRSNILAVHGEEVARVMDRAPAAEVVEADETDTEYYSDIEIVLDE